MCARSMEGIAVYVIVPIYNLSPGAEEMKAKPETVLKGELVPASVVESHGR